MTRVYVGMVGDLFHIGHLNLLKQAKQYGDYLIVGVERDSSAQLFKRKPIIPFEQRIEIVKAIKGVDLVVPIDEDRTKVLRDYQPDVLVHGDDWLSATGKQAELRDTICNWMYEHGKEVVFVPYTEGISTSKIIEEIKYGSLFENTISTETLCSLLS